MQAAIGDDALQQHHQQEDAEGQQQFWHQFQVVDPRHGRCELLRQTRPGIGPGCSRNHARTRPGVVRRTADYLMLASFSPAGELTSISAREASRWICRSRTRSCLPGFPAGRRTCRVLAGDTRRRCGAGRRRPCTGRSAGLRSLLRNGLFDLATDHAVLADRTRRHFRRIMSADWAKAEAAVVARTAAETNANRDFIEGISGDGNDRAGPARSCATGLSPIGTAEGN